MNRPRPPLPALFVAAGAGIFLAYQKEAPAKGPNLHAKLGELRLPTSAFPDSMPSSAPASAPSSAPSWNLGDETRAPRAAQAPLFGSDILGAPAETNGPSRVKLDELRFRFLTYVQRGQGFQSVDGASDGPGKEDALIFQPMAYFGLVQSEKLRHDITVPVDIVSAASVDALDAISTASRVNEAGGIDVTTTYKSDPQTDLTFRYGAHIEEPYRSWFAGFGMNRRMAQDNATLSVSGNATFDLFDFVTTQGGFRGVTTREAVNTNVSFSQILSPTTLADASYGMTYQLGTLQTTYNSIPLDGTDARGEEVLPRARLRNAASVRLAQHIPQSRSTIKGSYRYYFDDFGLIAHTAEAQFYQYLAPWLYVRGSYRFYTQTGVEFFGESFSPDISDTTPRTSDSDLAPFNANEYEIKVVMLGAKAPFLKLKSAFLDASFSTYDRSNDLSVNTASLAYGRKF
jgi:Protein of unknown function (DUF3570)